MKSFLRLFLLLSATALMAGSSGNGQDPSKHCSECGNKITTTDSGNESGHSDTCEWNPKNQ